MKIFCIGRNYVNHAHEMNASIPEKPLFFMKPDTAILGKKEDVYYPDFTNDIHYECELVVRIHKVGKNISEKFAHKYYEQVGIGLDLTARDLQSKCKENGHPWEIAKAFDNSAPIGTHFLSLENKNIQNINFHLLKNGKIVQKGNSKDMIFSVDKIIAYLSKFFTLKTGDLIFTGTPEGVGSIAIGDRLEAYIEDEKLLDLTIK